MKRRSFFGAWLDHLESDCKMPFSTYWMLILCFVNYLLNDYAWAEWPMAIVLGAYVLSLLALLARGAARGRTV